MGSPALFAGEFVKFLKSKLNLSEIAYIIPGSADPRSVATLAPKGSLYLRQGTIGQLFVKLDDGSTTNWSLIASTDDLIGDIDPASGFAMAFRDVFDVPETDATSLVDDTFTNAIYDPVLAIYRLFCDKSKTITTTGTSFTLSATPTFVLAPGDIIYNATQNTWRRVVTFNGITSGTIDAAFSPDLAAAACTLSQAVWTKDIVNATGSAVQTTRPRDFYPNTDIESINIDYFDSLAASDGTPDFIDTARIVASYSNEGLQADVGTPLSTEFQTIYTRPEAPNAIDDYALSANTDKQRLFGVFFCNPANGSVTTGANLIAYKVSFYPAPSSYPGGILDSAFAMSDGSGTEINCSAPFVFSGKTRLTMNWDFIPGLRAGETSGDLEVIVDGEVLPRFVSGATNDAYYLEVPGTTNTIEFWANLSSLTISIEVRRRQAVIDQSDNNTAAIAEYNSPLIVSTGPTTLETRRYTRALLNHSGAITVNLPASPTVGDRVMLHDVSQAAATNNVTVGRNGSNIMSVAADDTIDLNGAMVEYEYVNVTIGWTARVF